jgi:hypothetical protein
MQQEARIRKNNRIMEEFGISGLSIDLRTLSRKKTTPKGQSPSSKGKRSGRDGCHGEGSDLSYTDLEEEPTPLANEVHLLSWLWGGGCMD